MRFIPEEIYHVYNRGNNHQKIFFNHKNYLHFLKKIRKEWMPYCEILCWCLMSNHFHFMLRATDISCKEVSSYGGKPMQLLARKIGLCLSSYSQYINHQNNTTGSLFQQKTKAKCISDHKLLATSSSAHISSANYIISCMHYIHQNPWKAGLVNKMEEWIFSSFTDYIGLRNGTLCNQLLLCQITDYNKENFYKDSYDIIEDELIKEIW
jgi:putative transposase